MTRASERPLRSITALLSATINGLQRSLALKLVLTSGVMLLGCATLMSFFSIRYQRSHAMQEVAAGADRLSTTIRLGAHYAMLINSREDINRIIQNVSRQEDIVHVRIYNKAGAIKFSNIVQEVEQVTNIRNEACYVCHKTEPPKSALEMPERTRIFTDPTGRKVVGILSPIYNEQSCSIDPCHYHPPDKLVLGALDVTMDLGGAESEILNYQRKMASLAVLVFLSTSALMTFILTQFVRRPIARLIEGARRIGRGYGFEPVLVEQRDEIGELAKAMNTMAEEIGEKQAELNRQRDEYRQLFAQVPCYVTVQNRDYRLLRSNRQFNERFRPAPATHCYTAYKGRLDKCPNCPVEKVFETGESQISEESGFNQDGSRAHWIVHATPIFDTHGNVTAAMEMCLDITERKKLEEQVRRSQREYAAVFQSIPTPVFVLDLATLTILDCNLAALRVYGYSKPDLAGRSFLDLFTADERERYSSQLRAFTVLNQVRNLDREGRPFYVDIMLSLAEYPGRDVLLLTATDITQRLEAEQKVIQAGKMATLGEMATGVAHELNQPLTVIKAASGFFVRKVDRGECIAPEILATMAREIDSYVDRASEIITHLRDFGRKPEMQLEAVDVNAVLRRSLELFSRQLSLRQIDVDFDLSPQLPPVMATANKLEQVFVNLLLNARDAIEERVEADPGSPRRITISSGLEGGKVVITLMDTGNGIPSAIQGRIFEPFFTTKKVGKGTGLGLSISYGLVKDFNGTIQAGNREDGQQGAAFMLRLPAAAPDIPALITRPDPAPTGRPGSSGQHDVGTAPAPAPTSLPPESS